MLSEAFAGAADAAEKRTLAQGDGAGGRSAAIGALRAMMPFDEAEARLLEDIIDFPDRWQPLIGLARTADERKDWPEALRRWTAVRQCFPDRREGYQGSASALQSLDRPAEAEPIWAEAAARFPEWLHPLWSHALIAHRRQDWPEADARWDLMRTRFPGEMNGYTFGAAALVELQRQHEAEALLDAAVARFPDRPQTLIAHARMAEQRKDWAEALRRWTVVRNCIPDRGEGYLGSAVALQALERPDEAEAIWGDAVERFPEWQHPLWSHALIAHRRQDWTEANARWALLRERFPGELNGYTFGAAALLQMQRQDDAEALLTAATARFPERPQPPVDHARIASERKDWPEALRRWTVVRKRFPDMREGYEWSAWALDAMQRPDEAEPLWAEAVVRFPDSYQPPKSHAFIAHRRQDWPEACARWELMRARFPNDLVGYTFGATALAECQRPDEAEALLLEAVTRFPDLPRPLSELAWLAQRRRDWPEALLRWTAMRERFPDEFLAYLGTQQALTELGRLREAEQVASEAVVRFPADGRVVREAGRLAGHMGDLGLALSRLEDAQRLLPGDDALATEIEAVRRRRLAAETAAREGIPAAVPENPGEARAAVEAPDQPVPADPIVHELAAEPAPAPAPAPSLAKQTPAPKARGGWMSRLLGIGS